MEPGVVLSAVECEPGPEGMQILPEGNLSDQICEFLLWTNCFPKEQLVSPAVSPFHKLILAYDSIAHTSRPWVVLLGQEDK